MLGLSIVCTNITLGPRSECENGGGIGHASAF